MFQEKSFHEFQEAFHGFQRQLWQTTPILTMPVKHGIAKIVKVLRVVP
jgi:hypothetical protein